MAFKSIQPVRRRLADEVYDEPIRAIMRRDIGPDDRLVQDKLAEDMGIGRTSVREALMRLEQEGVLEVSNRGSFRLYQLSDDEVRELYQSRAAIVGQCARILAVHRTDEVLDRLRRVIAREEAVKETSAQPCFEANRNIHRALVEEARNRVLPGMCDMIRGKAMVFPLFATIENVDLARSLGDHMALVDVIASGDRGAALEAFIDHIQEGYDLQMAGIKAAG